MFSDDWIPFSLPFKVSQEGLCAGLNNAQIVAATEKIFDDLNSYDVDDLSLLVDNKENKYDDPPIQNREFFINFHLKIINSLACKFRNFTVYLARHSSSKAYFLFGRKILSSRTPKLLAIVTSIISLERVKSNATELFHRVLADKAERKYKQYYNF